MVYNYDDCESGKVIIERVAEINTVGKWRKRTAWKNQLYSEDDKILDWHNTEIRSKVPLMIHGFNQ